MTDLRKQDALKTFFELHDYDDAVGIEQDFSIFYDHVVPALLDRIEKLEKLVSDIEGEAEMEMSRADHKKKIANMDYHDSEVHHQEGRWHCAHDLAEYINQRAREVLDA